MTKKRNISLDYLKVLAVLFVVMLHVNGYTASTFSLKQYSLIAEISYYVLEAISIPSIHLFVLIGSFFMVEKINAQRNIYYIYSQTWLVTVTGLFFCIIMLPNELTFKGGVLSIFPFTQRAYWFVSDYLVLLLLSPFYTTVVRYIDNRSLFCLTCLLFTLTCIFPFISVTGWDKGNLLLFSLLYFIAAVVKKNESIIIKFGKKWIVLWGLMIVLIILSVIVIKLFATKFSWLIGKELFFYQHASPLVVLEGVFLFNFFIYKNDTACFDTMPAFMNWVCHSSLLVYLFHMHPIFKNLYVKYSILGFIDVSSVWYFAEIILTVVAVVIVGSILGEFIFIPASKVLATLIEKRLSSFINMLTSINILSIGKKIK